ncbi:hypothetical protein O0L34_g1124 [Tuta absoluta]|nr:hypothetical protein O0L34_g1124 [Tuta absoluta]
MVSVRPLPADLAEKARLELNEDPARLAADLQHLKEWIAKQPHLRARTDDQWLVAFLRGCKFSLERTKEKLDLFYSVQTTAPECFSFGVKDPKFHELLDLGAFLILPKANGTDPVVSIMKPGSYDPDKFTVLDTIACSHALEKILMMENDNSTVAGTVTILDLENVTFGHFIQMTPATMKKMVVIGQDATPFRMKGTHFLNTPPGFETIFNAMKSLLNSKNQQRLYVHNKNYEEMYKHISKDVLPAEYGGNGGTTKEIIEYWKKKVEEYKDWLEEDEKFGTDEKLRPGKPKTAESMFGVEGSFRKLEFD